MTLIWNGRGWSVLASAFGCSLISEIITRSISHSDKYYDDHGTPIAIALFSAAVIVHLVYRGTWKISTDEDGRTTEVIKPAWIDHSFFFVSISVWPLILGAYGIGVLYSRGP